MSKPNLPPLPDLRGDVVNEAFWKCINSTRHTLPSYIVDDLKPAIYAALCHVLPIYAEEAVRQALLEAAGICNRKFIAMAERGFPREASTARKLTAEIVALIPENCDG